MSSEGNSDSITVRDNYTYFVISEDARLVNIDKLHFCSWRYKKSWFPLIPRRRLLEIGMQIRINEVDQLKLAEDGARRLNVSLIIPWLKKGAKWDDLYKAIKETKNARFIFNADVEAGETFDGGEGDKGIVLKFEKPICALPVSCECHDGRVDFNIVIPRRAPVKEMPIYVRAVVEVARQKFCYANSGMARTLYTYDVKVNVPRNIPSSIRADTVCKVSACYCLHIVPSHYQLSFYDVPGFQDIRLLEHIRYNHYVEHIPLFKKNVDGNQYQVIFNKKVDQKFSFFSLFNSEHIGITPLLIAILINLLCTVILSFKGKLFPSEGAHDVINATCCPRGPIAVGNETNHVMSTQVQR